MKAAQPRDAGLRQAAIPGRAQARRLVLRHAGHHRRRAQGTPQLLLPCVSSRERRSAAIPGNRVERTGRGKRLVGVEHDVIRSPGTPADRARADRSPDITELFRERHLELVRLALLIVGDLGTTEDVVQDAFEQLHRPDGARLAVTFQHTPLTGQAATGRVEVVDLGTGTTSASHDKTMPDYWPGVPSWADDETLTVPWWHYIAQNSGDGMTLTAIHRIDTSRPDGVLVTTRVITYPVPVSGLSSAIAPGPRCHGRRITSRNHVK